MCNHTVTQIRCQEVFDCIFLLPGEGLKALASTPEWGRNMRYRHEFLRTSMRREKGRMRIRPKRSLMRQLEPHSQRELDGARQFRRGGIPEPIEFQVRWK